MRLKRKGYQMLLPLFIGAGAISCSQGKSEQAHGATAMKKELPVLQVAACPITLHDDYPATIEGMQVVEIRPKIDGYIEKVYVNEGASVKKGQLLFHISNPSYEEAVKTAEAGIKSAEANLSSAQLEQKKVKALVDNKVVNDYELESAELEVKAKDAALSEAKASLATAQANLDYTYIHSPYDGVIGSIPYRIGALVSSSSSDALTTLSQNSVMYAYFSVNEKDLMALSRKLEGKNMQEKLGTLEGAKLILSDGSEYQEKGTIEMASSLVETATGSVRMKAIFPNPEGILWSGASAKVRLPKTYESALLVPQSATSEVLNKTIVYVVDAENKVRSTAISVVASDDGQYYIVTNGLNVNDRIVLEGITRLSDGTEIVPKVSSLTFTSPTDVSNGIQKN